MDLKSNEYYESLRDKVAADIFTRKMTSEVSESAYQELLHAAEQKSMTLEDYIACHSIDYANTFITMLRREKTI